MHSVHSTTEAFPTAADCQARTGFYNCAASIALRPGPDTSMILFLLMHHKLYPSVVYLLVREPVKKNPKEYYT